jgi:hypothetical protein
LGGCCRSCPIRHFGGGREDPTVLFMGRFLLRERTAQLPASIAGCVHFPYGSIVGLGSGTRSSRVSSSGGVWFCPRAGVGVQVVGCRVQCGIHPCGLPWVAFERRHLRVTAFGNQHQLHNKRCGHHLWRPRLAVRGGWGGAHRARPRELESHIRRPASAGSGAATSVAVPVRSSGWVFGQRVVERQAGRSTIRQQTFVRSHRVGHPLQRGGSTLGTKGIGARFQRRRLCLEK